MTVLVDMLARVKAKQAARRANQQNQQARECAKRVQQTTSGAGAYVELKGRQSTGTCPTSATPEKRTAVAYLLLNQSADLRQFSTIDSNRGSDNQRIGQKIMIFSKGGLRQRKKLAQWPLAGARR
jgi:hypothetical protein